MQSVLEMVRYIDSSNPTPATPRCSRTPLFNPQTFPSTLFFLLLMPPLGSLITLPPLFLPLASLCRLPLASLCRLLGPLRMHLHRTILDPGTPLAPTILTMGSHHLHPPRLAHASMRLIPSLTTGSSRASVVARMTSVRNPLFHIPYLFA